MTTAENIKFFNYLISDCIDTYMDKMRWMYKDCAHDDDIYKIIENTCDKTFDHIFEDIIISDDINNIDLLDIMTLEIFDQYYKGENDDEVSNMVANFNLRMISETQQLFKRYMQLEETNKLNPACDSQQTPKKLLRREMCNIFNSL